MKNHKDWNLYDITHDDIFELVVQYRIAERYIICHHFPEKISKALFTLLTITLNQLMRECKDVYEIDYFTAWKIAEKKLRDKHEEYSI